MNEAAVSAQLLEMLWQAEWPQEGYAATEPTSTLQLLRLLHRRLERLETPGLNAEHLAVLRQDLADYRALHGDLVKQLTEKDARIAELEAAVAAEREACAAICEAYALRMHTRAPENQVAASKEDAAVTLAAEIRRRGE